MALKLKKFDKTFERALENIISDIEEKTSVEVVVAITPRSDSYIDTYFKCGLLCLTGMLFFLLYSPVSFSEIFVPLDLAGAFAIGAFIVWLFPPIMRLLVSPRRKEGYVNAAANSYFLENKLDETVERTAFLIFISVLERKCKLIADKGIIESLPVGVMKEIEITFQKILAGGVLPQTILKIMPELSTPFSEYLPPAENNIDELSNRLRRIEC